MKKKPSSLSSRKTTGGSGRNRRRLKKNLIGALSSSLLPCDKLLLGHLRRGQWLPCPGPLVPSSQSPQQSRGSPRHLRRGQWLPCPQSPQQSRGSPRLQVFPADYRFLGHSRSRLGPETKVLFQIIPQTPSQGRSAHGNPAPLHRRRLHSRYWAPQVTPPRRQWPSVRPLQRRLPHHPQPALWRMTVPMTTMTEGAWVGMVRGAALPGGDATRAGRFTTGASFCASVASGGSRA